MSTGSEHEKSASAEQGAPPATKRWAGHRILYACSLVLAVASIALLTLPARGSSPHADHAGPPGTEHGVTATAPGAASSGMPGMAAMPGMPGMPGMAGTPGMAGMPADATGEGLATERDGYRFDSTTGTLPAAQAVSYPFTITGPDGRPVTDFAEVQTKQLHFYAIRSDLTGYQHLHPTMAADGTWAAGLTALEPGDWRLYAAFTPNTGPGKGRETVLSRTVTVPGRADAQPLPAPTGTTTVDGYTVAVQGQLTAGTPAPLTVTISKDGLPVTDLQPYLDSYAHLSIVHEGDRALAHLHPFTPVRGDHGGPALTFYALLGEAGHWRAFLQFQTDGKVHTAALTVDVA
ncbi:hypothetical protein AB0D10_15630 [Kitasatospora sp. NPDC048545]|uniref:hypothetical protein n=1 Tax=Kitasatospora sp. NPDC048545 TaxID=3157208 RepID=UPI0033F7A97D